MVRLSHKCQVAYILKDYIRPVIQLLTNDLKDYNMRLLTTKCLNTGVMLMMFMAGKKMGLEVTEYCDNNTTIERHKKGDTNNYLELSALKIGVMSRSFQLRQLYYVLMSDGYFTRGSSDKAYFPGHVFIIEKVKAGAGEQNIYYLYQSYINEYDLGEHMKRGTVKMNEKQMSELMDGISYIYRGGVWDDKCSRIWRKFTRVDASNFEGYNVDGNSFLCSRNISVNSCVENIEIYLKQKLDELRKTNADVGAGGKIYGDASKYYDSSKALTNSQMEIIVDRLLHKIRARGK